jgi:hypothetical protein
MENSRLSVCLSVCLSIISSLCFNMFHLHSYAVDFHEICYSWFCTKNFPPILLRIGQIYSRYMKLGFNFNDFLETVLRARM